MSELNEHDTLPPSMDPAVDGGIVEPPTDFFGILKRLGPGLIIAGSIVGSGELIATTKTGAQAGISLLWLIIIGCLIKVFAQIELGRHAISHGETTLSALDRIPGPRLRMFWTKMDASTSGKPIEANWVIWFWGAMMLCTIGQLGGIVGGVGMSLAITFPISGDYVDAISVPAESEFKRYIKWEDDLDNGGVELAKLSESRQQRVQRAHINLKGRIETTGERGEIIIQKLRAGQPLIDDDTGISLVEPPHYDDAIWAAVVAIFTAGLLYRGRYLLIQNISMVLVVAFTFVTIGNVVALQMKEQFALSLSDFMRGLSFGAPEAIPGISTWGTALATFGIIGVGASELIAYPYWCLEKGYAKFAGPRTDDPGWAKRARGWMMVMHYDAFASMIVYTVATLAFYIMGVAVLYKDGLDPDGMRMVSTLAEAYVPVFGEYTKWLFLSGAIAVLYSTFMVANAGNARMVTDALKVFGLLDRNNEQTHDRSIATFSVILPLLCLAVYVIYPKPVTLILLAGTMQAAMLPIVGLGAILFRYKMTDQRLRPSLLWDVMLVLSFGGLLLAGVWTVYTKLFG